MKASHLTKVGTVKRAALVLGNEAYLIDRLRLEKPKTDALQIRRALRRLGYRCFGQANLTFEKTEVPIGRFIKSIGPGTTAVIYLSGHGIQIGGENFFLPVDITQKDVALEQKVISVQSLVRSASSKADTTIVFLDMCRENPFVNSLNKNQHSKAMSKGLKINQSNLFKKGLAQFSATDESTGSGVFAAFAADSGEIAWEGHDECSNFTQAILNHIETAELSLEGLMFRVSNEVRVKTNGEQVPTVSHNLQRPFFFNARSYLWITANLMALVALIVSMATLAVTNYYRPSLVYVGLSAAVLTNTLAVFLVALNRSFKFSRGELQKEAKRAWASSFTSGFLGAVIVAPVMAVSYYISAFEQLSDPFGQVMTEVLLGCILAGVTLGPLSYGLAVNQYKIAGPDKVPKPYRVIGAGIVGGLLAGLLIGPIDTWYFGQLQRPNVDALQLLPAGLLGVVVAIFSILTYSFEKLNYAVILDGIKASLVATAIVSILFGSLIWLNRDAIGSLVEGVLGTVDDLILLLIGAVIGPVIGVVLGSAIGLSLYLIKDGKKFGL